MTQRSRITRAAILSIISTLALVLGSGCNPKAKDSSKSIKIGVLAPFNTQPGEGIRNGVAMAVQEINAAGGVDGRPLEVIEINDEYSPCSESRATASFRSWSSWPATRCR